MFFTFTLFNSTQSGISFDSNISLESLTQVYSANAESGVTCSGTSCSNNYSSKDTGGCCNMYRSPTGKRN